MWWIITGSTFYWHLFNPVYLRSSLMVGPWYHRQCLLDDAYVTCWVTCLKKLLETQCKLKSYLQTGPLPSTFKLLPFSALAWTMMLRKLSKMAQTWKPKNIETEKYIDFHFFPLFLLAFYLNIHCIYLSFTTLAIGFLQHHRISCNIYMLMMLVMLLLLSSQTRPKESHSLFLESSSILKNLWFFKSSIRKFPDEWGLKFWTAFKSIFLLYSETI